jgi:DNA-binding LytR/AlgR family response regulator
MITAVAIDDEPLALDVIKAFCERASVVTLVRTFTDTKEALKYLQKNPVDLLFLDIRMPAMSGIEFYKQLPNDTMAIFTTAYSEYAVEGFNLNAIDYLLKPFEYERFKKAVDKANEYHAALNVRDSVSQQYLYIRADYSIMKIAFTDIQYIEGLDNYLKIHLLDQKPIVARMSMKAMAEKLPEDEFVRVHRSYIIPFSKVTAVRNKIIHLGDIQIPIGSNYVDVVSDLFNG